MVGVNKTGNQKRKMQRESRLRINSIQSSSFLFQHTVRAPRQITAITESLSTYGDPYRPSLFDVLSYAVGDSISLRYPKLFIPLMHAKSFQYSAYTLAAGESNFACGITTLHPPVDRLLMPTVHRSGMCDSKVLNI